MALQDPSIGSTVKVGGWALRRAISRVVNASDLSVSLADPSEPDVPLVAISRGFEAMMGYTKGDVVGENCRFLSEGCLLSTEDRVQLRVTCQTGCPFSGLIPNRKKDGKNFVNFLDLRGLHVGDTENGQKWWYLLGVQADVTDLPFTDAKTLQERARENATSFHARLVEVFAQLVKENSREGANPEDASEDFGEVDAFGRQISGQSSEQTVTLLREPRWIEDSTSQRSPTLPTSQAGAAGDRLSYPGFLEAYNAAAERLGKSRPRSVGGGGGRGTPEKCQAEPAYLPAATTGLACILAASFVAGLLIGRRSRQVPAD